MKSCFNSIKNNLLKVFLVFIIIFVNNTIQAQIFQMNDRTYKFIDNRWFSFTSGEKGDPIYPHRLIVRLKNREDLRHYDFDQLGLLNIQVITQRLLGDYFKEIISISTFDLKTRWKRNSAGFLFRLHLVNCEGVVPMWI